MRKMKTKAQSLDRKRIMIIANGYMVETETSRYYGILVDEDLNNG